MDKDPHSKGMINLPSARCLVRYLARGLWECPKGTPRSPTYQAGFKPLLYGILAALVLTLFLKETGPAARKS